MLFKQNVLYYLIILVMVLSACAPQSSPSGQSTRQPTNEMPSQDSASSITAAKTALSQKLSIPEDELQLISAVPIEWPDSCLGLGGPAESCLQTITPGYKVILSVESLQVEIHTDETGNQVRIKE